MTGLLADIASSGLSVLITVAVVRLASPLVLEFRPRESHIVIAAIVAELASEIMGAVVGQFWKPDIANFTVVSLVLTLSYVAVIDVLAFNWIVRDPNGKRMGIANASLFAIILAAVSIVFFSIMLVWTDTPLRVW